MLDSNSSHQQKSQVHGQSDSDLDHTYSSYLHLLPFSDPNAWNDEPPHFPDLVEQESTSTFPVKHSTTTHSSSVGREVQTDRTHDPTGSQEDDSATIDSRDVARFLIERLPGIMQPTMVGHETRDTAAFAVW